MSQIDFIQNYFILFEINDGEKLLRVCNYEIAKWKI